MHDIWWLGKLNYKNKQDSKIHGGVMYMLDRENYVTTDKGVEPKKLLYSLNDNWDSLKPYLEVPEVQESLAKCLGYDCVENWNQEKDVPWENNPTCYWDTGISEKIRNDTEYQSALNSLFYLIHGDNADQDDDEAWDKLYISDEFFKLKNRFWDKYKPKKGEIQWYQWIHGCFYIAPFVATLLNVAMKDIQGVVILTSKSHSVACFFMDNIMYYADLLVEWDSIEQLEKFMGEVTQITWLPRHSIDTIRICQSSMANWNITIGNKFRITDLAN
jgi:hypothetical protein